MNGRAITTDAQIGLALSGGGSRAMAFHLGCLRALHDLNLLNQIKVVSTVSGGSVIGGLLVVNSDPFPEFELRVRSHLSRGFVQPMIIKLITTTEGLKALTCGLLLLLVNFPLMIIRFTIIRWMGILLSKLLPLKEGGISWARKFHLPIRRFASQTTILRRVFNDDLFNGIRLIELPEDAPLLIVIAAELRTGSAFYFSQQSSGTWRLGELADRNTSLAHAVAASAAFPLLLPALDEVLVFNAKDGTSREERVSLSDGGSYDNLGLAPLWPDRNPKISLNVTETDTVICCSAGYGLRFHEPTQFFIGRLKSVYFCLFDRTQNAAMRRLFDLLKSRKLKGVIMPYLGDNDRCLAQAPKDLVRREEVDGYPTNFSSMPEEWIERLSRRGEQLTRALVAEHLSHLVK